MKALHLTHNDSMLVITSAGDNALHYAIGAQPSRVSDLSYQVSDVYKCVNLPGQIHCVDMNP